MASRFHHTGFVVPSISAEAAAIARSLSIGWDGKITHDPLQMVNVTFLPSIDSDRGSVELVEPAGKRSPVLKFAESGGGLHHVCYEVGDLSDQLAQSQANGDVLVRVPLRAAAFGGRRIAWVRTKSQLLVEFLELTAS